MFNSCIQLDISEKINIRTNAQMANTPGNTQIISMPSNTQMITSKDLDEICDILKLLEWKLWYIYVCVCVCVCVWRALVSTVVNFRVP